MYEIIEQLCSERGIKPGRLCAELGISRGTLSDLKASRTKKLSAENIAKISAYFGVSADRLLGKETEKIPVESGKRTVSDDEIMFALWGDADDVDKGDLEDVMRYAAFVRERKRRK